MVMTENGEEWGRVMALSQKVCSEKKKKKFSSEDIQSRREIIKLDKIQKGQGNVRSSVRLVHNVNEQTEENVLRWLSTIKCTLGWNGRIQNRLECFRRKI